MDGRLLNSVGKLGERVSKFIRKLEKRIEAEEIKFDFENKIPSTDLTLDEFANEITLLVGLVKGRQTSLPESMLLNSELNDQILEMITLIEAADEKASATGSLNMESFAVTHPNSGTQNFETDLNEIISILKDFLKSHYPWLVMQGDENGAQFLTIYNSLKKNYENVKNTGRTINGIKTKSENTFNDIEETSTEAAEALDSIRDLEGEASTSKTSTDSILEAAKEVQSLIKGRQENIESINVIAEKLKEEVNEYRKNLKEFDDDLDARNELFNDLEKRHNDLITDNEAIALKIIGLNKKAEEMLSGATTSGLAKEFSTYRDALKISVRFAAWAFYGSIALLLIFSVPLIIMVVPPLAGILEAIIELPNGTLTPVIDTKAPSDFKILADTSARLLLVVPFFWLATFMSKRHGRLFRLREHYAYKRSIAASVDGFKKQAPNYADEIAAAAFLELTFNPAERMDKGGEEERVPNPIIQWILTRLEKSKTLKRAEDKLDAVAKDLINSE